ncbi:hypothetical protein KGQ74_03270, partial [Patescibacteria group bacterium]|nr:hypothetical protein [Patescibacteria group bacterium]
QVNAYTGFSAQNVQANIPQAVATDSRGYLTLDERPILAAVVNAVKGIGQVAGDFASTLTGWLGNAANGIAQLFAGEIDTQKLCIGDTCVTQTQLARLLAQNGMVSSGGPTPPPADSSSSPVSVSTSSATSTSFASTTTGVTDASSTSSGATSSVSTVSSPDTVATGTLATTSDSTDASTTNATSSSATP